MKSNSLISLRTRASLTFSDNFSTISVADLIPDVTAVIKVKGISIATSYFKRIINYITLLSARAIGRAGKWRNKS